MTNAQQHPRCAAWARDVGLDPAGTAPRSDVVVLVEHPMPWPDDISSDPLLAELARVATEQAGGAIVRLQAVATDPASTTREVVVFRRGDLPFSGYDRVASAGPVGELAAVVAELVGSERRQPASSSVTDVLICTHGGRDVCCGSLGTRLWMEAERAGLGEEVRLWRTSHTGGHRFAPTAITFPDGNYWAHLDVDTLRGIVDRTLPVEVAANHLRGCAAHDATVQVADRAVLAERGWAWLDYARFGKERGVTRVELCFESPTGERGGYDVLLAEGRRMPVPECGADPAAATKSQSELRVARLQHWT